VGTGRGRREGWQYFSFGSYVIPPRELELFCW
jgi:hypothetical protein